MDKTVRPRDVDQVWLFPPSVRDLVPPDHLAHLVRDLVREKLDLSEILETYDEARGYPPCHPAMMKMEVCSRAIWFIAPNRRMVILSWYPLFRKVLRNLPIPGTIW